MEGDVLVTVLAMDDDTDVNNHNEIHYIITGGNEDGIFEIPNPMVWMGLPSNNISAALMFTVLYKA